MFFLIEELWKAQQYSNFDCGFNVPMTFIIRGKSISQYFSSVKCQGKILKKRKENVSLTTMQEILREETQIQFSRLMDDGNVHIRNLNSGELERLITDMRSFPELYDNVIIQETFPSNDYMIYRRNNRILMLQHRIPLNNQLLITLSDNGYENEKICFESRLQRAGECAERMLCLVQGNQIKEIELYFKYLDNKLIIVYNPQLINHKLNGILTFSYNVQYLYNQKLYDQFKKQDVIQDNKGQQCGCCLKLVKLNQCYEVLRNSIWKIRMHLNLHHLNDQQLKFDSNGRAKLIIDQFKFIKICGTCYNGYIQIIQNLNQNQNQNRKNRLISQSITQSLKQQSQQINRKKSLSVQKPQNQNQLFMDDFDAIVQKIDEQQSTLIGRSTISCSRNKTRTQSANNWIYK